MKSSTRPRRRLTSSEARRLLATARRSGWSVSEAARRAGLPYTTLHAWKRKFARPSRPSVRLKPAFIEVCAPAAATAPAALEIQTPSGFTLRLAPGFAVADLQRILESLDAR